MQRKLRVQPRPVVTDLKCSDIHASMNLVVGLVVDLLQKKGQGPKGVSAAAGAEAWWSAAVWKEAPSECVGAMDVLPCQPRPFYLHRRHCTTSRLPRNPSIAAELQKDLLRNHQGSAITKCYLASLAGVFRRKRDSFCLRRRIVLFGSRGSVDNWTREA